MKQIDSLKSDLRKKLWFAAIRKLQFEDQKIAVRFLASSTCDGFRSVKAKCYKGLGYVHSGYRKYTIFHISTGTSIMADVKGIRFTQVLIALMVASYNWEKEIDEVLFKQEIDEMIDLIQNLRKDPGEVFNSPLYDEQLSKVLG